MEQLHKTSLSYGYIKLFSVLYVFLEYPQNKRDSNANTILSSNTRASCIKQPDTKHLTRLLYRHWLSRKRNMNMKVNLNFKEYNKIADVYEHFDVFQLLAMCKIYIVLKIGHIVSTPLLASPWFPTCIMTIYDLRKRYIGKASKVICNFKCFDKYKIPYVVMESKKRCEWVGVYMGELVFMRCIVYVGLK